MERPVIVLDPFAGGCTRGVIAAKMGLFYVGIDISPMQVAANREIAREACGECNYQPLWVCGDSLNTRTHFSDALQSSGFDPSTPADFVFSCPPYYNLEMYTKIAGDLSGFPTYEKFLEVYATIVRRVCESMRSNHICMFVVANLRDKSNGNSQLPFHSDTLRAFMSCGMLLHQDAVLYLEKGSAAMRARRITSAGSKLAITHQNVCIFSNGVFTPAHARKFGIRANSDDVPEM